MNNKLFAFQPTRTRKLPQPSPKFQLDLSSSQIQQQNSLAYSASPKFISLSQLPHKNIITSQIINEFKTSQMVSSKEHTFCTKKDQMDKIFGKVKIMNRSLTTGRMISPSKIDITLHNKSAQFSKNDKERTIHSRSSPKRHIQKDLLKQFRQIQQMRKVLRSRPFLEGTKINLGIIGGTSQTNVSSRIINPQKTQLYNQVRSRIGRRYNNMFKRCGQNKEIKQQILRQIVSARSMIRSSK